MNIQRVYQYIHHVKILIIDDVNGGRRVGTGDWGLVRAESSCHGHLSSTQHTTWVCSGPDQDRDLIDRFGTVTLITHQRT